MTIQPSSEKPLRLGIASLGAIGLEVARRVDRGEVEGMVVSAVCARDHAKAEHNLGALEADPAIVPIAEIGDHADVILECAPAAVFEEIARSAVENGRVFVPLSVGALLNHMDLVERARNTGARIMVPTGALIGLDAVKAVAQGPVESVTMVTRKPPRGLKGAPHLVENGISLDNIAEATRVFAGSAREAAIGFPANVNVAAALALAGVGPDATTIEIWADPAVSRNIHTITVVSDASNCTMSIENVPSDENPATGKITSLSAIATLQRLTAPLVVGT